MPIPRRGEVWLIDFGLAGKTRPALVVSVAFGEQDRSLITVVPHTTSLRGSPFEITVPVPFLKPGAFRCGVSPPSQRLRHSTSLALSNRKPLTKFSAACWIG